MKLFRNIFRYSTASITGAIAFPILVFAARKGLTKDNTGEIGIVEGTGEEIARRFMQIWYRWKEVQKQHPSFSQWLLTVVEAYANDVDDDDGDGGDEDEDDDVVIESDGKGGRRVTYTMLNETEARERLISYIRDAQQICLCPRCVLRVVVGKESTRPHHTN